MENHNFFFFVPKLNNVQMSIIANYFFLCSFSGSPITHLILEGFIEFFMSLIESVKDLNSKEFRSPPSARHCKGKGSYTGYKSPGEAAAIKGRLQSGRRTFICRRIAVSLDMRSVRLSFCTHGCPLDVFA